ncbi:MAG: DUF1707 domain-containing protein [Pseudonocardia sp.]|nr:DUF1707 domain-containing protein [Pseudonocardia sp.]
MADERRPGMRVSDRERGETEEWLRTAMGDGRLTLDEFEERAARCWAARTRADLDVLTEDLPRPGAVVSPTVGAAPAPVPTGGRTLGQRIGSKLGSLLVLGAGVVAVGAVATSADGGAIFSSRVVQVADDATTVQVGALFGSTKVVVPDGVAVRSSGVMVFGSTDCDQACSSPAGARVLTVETRGAFGSVDILTRAEAASGALDDDRDD